MAAPGLRDVQTALKAAVANPTEPATESSKASCSVVCGRLSWAGLAGQEWEK